MVTNDQFRALYDEHQAFVRNLIFRHAGPSFLDDAVQETFIKAFHGLDNFRQECSLKSWIARIALNVTNDMLRKKKRLSWLSLAKSEKEEVPQIAVSPEVDKMIESETLKKALQSLSPKLRETLILFSVEELTIKEISEIQQIPEGTVKSRINSGRSQLKKQFEYLDFEGDEND